MDYLVEPQKVIPILNLKYNWLIDPVPELKLMDNALTQDIENQVNVSLPRRAAL